MLGFEFEGFPDDEQSTSTALRRVATWKLQGPPSPELEPEPVASGVEMILQIFTPLYREQTDCYVDCYGMTLLTMTTCQVP